MANIDFYLKTIPLFDAGDDVGMVLSPQCFHNLYVGADIFNHGNINFWEYAQHGYDVYGFCSCTGEWSSEWQHLRSISCMPSMEAAQLTASFAVVHLALAYDLKFHRGICYPLSVKVICQLANLP